jgi:DNA invertase Pin-like site-specific DNA recombinase
MGAKLIAERKIVLAAIRRGATLAAAAQKAGVSSSYVCKCAQAAGLVPSKKQKSNKALKLLREGEMSVADIAKAAKLSRVAVYAIKRKELADKSNSGAPH